MPDTLPARRRLASRIDGLRPSLYARVLSRLSAYGGEVYPFHIGETWLLPTVAVKQALQEADDRSLHRYGHPQGVAPLREALAARLQESGHDVTAADVMVTHGATHALSLACQAVLEPGDEVLVLSPHWPLVTGMVHTAGARPIEVPFTCSLRDDDSPSIEERLAPYVTERTRAIYVTSPNNPCGTVLTAGELERLARFCVAHDLYAFADEAYERFCFVDRPPPLASFPGMKERAISVFTFSKSHRMAGLRVGYAAAPPDVLDAMIKLANLSVYNVSLLMQRAALVALERCEDDVQQTARVARESAALLAELLDGAPGLRFRRPEGGAYIFADLGEVLGDRDCFELLDACLDEGVVFSPGAGFGAPYARWGRFCFTAMEPDHLRRGADRLASVLERFAARA